MTSSLLKTLFCIVLFGSCASSSRNSRQAETIASPETFAAAEPGLAPETIPQPLTDLPQTQYGGFVLKPGLYEAEFKTYCLQPGTPDPREGDAYLQGPVSGYRKEIVESVLLNSREMPEIEQKNVQLLLWSVVSGSDFQKLPYAVQADARRLLTPKQVFELKGGVMGVIKNVSSTTGILHANKDMKRLFETGMNSYETYERLAVRQEASRVVKKGVKYDQWYRQQENYYVRYFPSSYKKVKIQVYVPEGLLDTNHTLNGEYLVFEPTGRQAIPAFTNAQRLGIGGPVIAIIKEVIRVNKRSTPPIKTPEKKQKNPKTGV